MQVYSQIAGKKLPWPTPGGWRISILKYAVADFPYSSTERENTLNDLRWQGLSTILKYALTNDFSFSLTERENISNDPKVAGDCQLF